MTSVDSGVETGNDSNDSGQAEIQVFQGFGRDEPPLVAAAVTNMETTNKPQKSESAVTEDGTETPTTTIICKNQTRIQESGMIRNELGAGTSVIDPIDLFFSFQNPPKTYELKSKTVPYNREAWLHRAIGLMQNPDVDIKDVECFFRNEKMRRKSSKLKGLSLNEKDEPMSETIFATHLAKKVARDQFHKSHWSRRMRLAAGTNNIELVTQMLQRGVSPNDQDEQGRTALHLACSRGYSEMVKLLLERGANPNQVDSLGNTPLHLAAITSKISVVTLLLKAGTDVLSSDRRGFNPLQLAQAKLRMLQNCKGSDTNRIKEEIHKVVNMLLAYLQKKNDVGEQIDALNSFYSKMSLSNTTDQVQGDVKNLLASINSLSITS